MNWTRSNSYYKQIRTLLEAVNEIHLNKTLDFNGCNYIPPLIAVPITALCNHYSNLHKQNVPTTNNSYHNAVKFPNGVEMKDNAQNFLSQYSSKGYLPILKIPTKDERNFNQLVSEINNHVCSSLKKNDSNFKSAVQIILSELFDNIKEHSEAQHAYFSFQNYPTSGFFDLCLCDMGVGLKGSYKDNDLDHSTAMQNVLNGISTKKNQNNNRGMGIRTSRLLSTRGFNGVFLLLSGNVLYSTEDNKILQIYCTFKGTIAYMRLRPHFKGTYWNYLE